MTCRAGLFVILSSMLLSGCYASPATYGYGRNYTSMSSSPSYPARSQQSYNPPSTPQVSDQPVFATPPVLAPAVIPTTDVVPSADPSLNAAANPMAFLPLILPVKDEWSSGKCPDVAVTFSGAAQSVPRGVADTASFEEARQYREGDYTEMAECFCVKAGNMSEIKKPAADAVMEQTGRQFADQLHLPVRHISYVDYSPVGRYSQFEASVDSPTVTRAVLRTYWRGQCSVRLAVVSVPALNVRAAAFINSLHVLSSEPRADDQVTSALPTVPLVPVETAIIPSESEGVDMTKPASTSGDLEQELQKKMDDPNGVHAAPLDPVPSPVVVASNLPDLPTGQNPVTRLRQLDDLKRKKLISQSEYDGKRQIILNGL